MLNNPTGYGKYLMIFHCEADLDQDFIAEGPNLFMLPRPSHRLTLVRQRGKHPDTITLSTPYRQLD